MDRVRGGKVPSKSGPGPVPGLKISDPTGSTLQTPETCTTRAGPGRGRPRDCNLNMYAVKISGI